MQSYRLTVDKFLDHAAKWFPDREVVEADGGRVIARASYAESRERSNLMSGALLSLGLEPGDRVGTLAWNTQHHFEIYYAAMGAGLVCHTLNPRLTPEQLAQIIVEAEDRVLAVSAKLLPLLQRVMPLCSGVEHVIVLDADAKAQSIGQVHVWPYEQLLESDGRSVTWGDFDEETAAGLCYTSGTTGSPKGVVYTHRSNYLHTLRSLQADAMALMQRDVVLMAVPMFHANGWGMPFVAPAVGSRLVLPGRHTDGASLARLIRDEGVTVATGVQTVWLGVVEHLRESGGSLPTLERIVIGGSNCPEALILEMEQSLGARVQTSWGMTELSPLGTISPPYGATATASGRPPIGLDLKLTDASGNTLPEQRNRVGHLHVKGASVVDRYFRAESDAVDEEGYFDTGDLAIIDDEGNLTISGRSKDLIKSGGEWINPAEIEAIIGRDPSVSLVAVISTPDQKWGERPLLIVQPREGERSDVPGLIGSLRGKVADWWIPERVAHVSEMPLAASGKIDKRQLRAEYEAGRIVAEEVER
jgi:3-(methylthio)propionyl---CoA ligase